MKTLEKQKKLYLKNLVENTNFENIDKITADENEILEIVKLLIQSGRGNEVAENIQKFISNCSEFKRIQIFQSLIEDYREDTISLNIDKITADEDEILEIVKLLIKSGRGDEVEENIQKFISNCSESIRIKIFRSLIRDDRAQTIGLNVDKITTDENDKLEIMNLIIQERAEFYASENIEKFISNCSESTRIKMAKLLIKNYEEHVVVENIGKITTDKDKKLEIFKLLIGYTNHLKLGKYIEKFITTSTSKDEIIKIYKSLIRNYQGYAVVEHMNEIIVDEDERFKIFRLLMKSGQEHIVFSNIQKFISNCSEQGRFRIYKFLIKNYSTHFIVLKIFDSNIDQGEKLKMFKLLLRHSGANIVVKILTQINLDSEHIFNLINYFMSLEKDAENEDIFLECFINEFRKLDKNQTNTLIKKILVIDDYKHIPILYRNKFSNLTENSLKFLIDDDEESLNLLKKSKEFNESLFTDKVKEYMSDERFLNYAYFNFKLWKSEHGNSKMQSIKDLVETHLSANYTKLNHNFIKSQPLEIMGVVDKVNEIKYREDFVLKFEKLYKYIENFKNSKSYIGIDFINAIEEVKIKKINQLQEKIKEMNGDIENKQHLVRNIEELELLDKSNLRIYIEKAIRLLGKNLDDDIMKYLLGRELKKNLILNGEYLNVKDPLKPTVEEINNIIALFDGILKVDSNLFKILDGWNLKSTKTKIKDVFNVKSLTEQVKTMTEISKDKTTELTCVPTRNMLTEFSGHIADACWVNEYKSMLASFPNLTSVFFVKDKDKQTESIQGACLLFETKSEDGEDLLIIRGLNPKETFINTLSAEDFYSKVTDYLKTIAERTNKRLAIVIDHINGASTNREAILRMLYPKKVHLKSVRLLDPDEVHFNTYDISNDTYFVD